MDMNVNKNLRRLAALALVLLLAGLIYAGVLYVQRRGTVAVEANVLPTNALLTINGESRSSGTIYLAPDTYSIEVSAEGFETDTQEITVTEANPPIIDVALNAVSDDAQAYVRENQRLYLEREARAGTRATERGEAMRERNPIINDLPVQAGVYSIGYRVDPSDQSGQSIILTIDSSPTYREAAIYQIKQLGYKPGDFKINFIDYEDPFAS